MANVRHPECAIRSLAKQAKLRLRDGARSYGDRTFFPQGAIRLKELSERGEEVVNPIRQLADAELLSGLSHDEKQRYVFQLAADYIAMKRELDNRTASYPHA